VPFWKFRSRLLVAIKAQRKTDCVLMVMQFTSCLLVQYKGLGFIYLFSKVHLKTPYLTIFWNE
jgi:hypothetical protein